MWTKLRYPWEVVRCGFTDKASVITGSRSLGRRRLRSDAYQQSASDRFDQVSPRVTRNQINSLNRCCQSYGAPTERVWKRRKVSITLTLLPSYRLLTRHTHRFRFDLLRSITSLVNQVRLSQVVDNTECPTSFTAFYRRWRTVVINRHNYRINFRKFCAASLPHTSFFLFFLLYTVFSSNFAYFALFAVFLKDEQTMMMPFVDGVVRQHHVGL